MTREKTKFILLFTVLLLSSFFVFSSIVSASESVNETPMIRSCIVNLSGNPVVFTASEFQCLYYDAERNISTETITVDGNPLSASFVYETYPGKIPFRYQEKGKTFAGMEETFDVIGYFGYPHVAFNGKADKIAGLVLDTDKKYTLYEGQGLSLGNGYIVIADQIDVDGRKFEMKLWHLGKEVDSKVVTLKESEQKNGGVTWILKENVLSEKDVPVMRVHINEMLRSGNSDIVEIEGIWLVDYMNATEASSEDIGKLKAQSIGSEKLVYAAENIKWSAGEKKQITDKWYLKSENASAYRICLAENLDSMSGYGFISVNVRGPIEQTGTTVFRNASDFPGFMYDFNQSICGETLRITTERSRIPKSGFVYETMPVSKKYSFSGWKATDNMTDSYYVAGWFGDPYVSVMEKNTETGIPSATGILAPLLADSRKTITMKQGSSLSLGGKYTLVPSKIDVNGGKVTLELRRNGELVDSSIVSCLSGTVNDRTWSCRQDLFDRKDVEICRVFVSDMFQGGNVSAIMIDGIWAIDAENAFMPESGDKFGDLEFTGLRGNAFVLENSKSFDFSKSNVSIGGGFSVRADKNMENYAVTLFRSYARSGDLSASGSSGGGGSGAEDAGGISSYPDMSDRLEELKDQIEMIEMMERGEWPPKNSSGNEETESESGKSENDSESGDAENVVVVRPSETGFFKSAIRGIMDFINRILNNVYRNVFVREL